MGPFNRSIGDSIQGVCLTMSRGPHCSLRQTKRVFLPIVLPCLLLTTAGGALSAATPPGPDAGLRALLGADPGLARLAAAYYAALARADADDCARLWSPDSPEAARGREAVQKLLAANGASELAALDLERADAGGDWAWLQVNADLRVPGDAGPPTAGRLHPPRRALRCRFEGGAWRIWDERPAAEDLALAVAAAPSAEAACAWLAAEGEPATAELAAALGELALQRARQRDLAGALRLLQRSRPLAAAAGSRHEEASALNREGVIWGMMGRYDRAVACLEESVSLWPPEDLSFQATAHFNLGRALDGQGELDRALAEYQRTVALRQKLGYAQGEAITLQNMGAVYYSLGNYRAALECYLRGLALTSPDDLEASAQALVHIGNVHSLQGDQELALDHYQRALELLQPLAPHPYIAVTENNIGSAYDRLKDYPRALEHYQKSLAQRDPEQYEGIANVLGNIASAQFHQGNTAEAEKSWREALRLFEQIGNLTGVAWIRGDLACFYLETSRPAEALAEAERSVAIARPCGQVDLLSGALTAAGSAHLALGQPEEARRDFDEAIRVTEEMRTRLAGGEQARESFFEDRLSPYQQMVSLLVRQGRPTEALAYAERAKARVLGEILRGGRVQFDRFMTAEERAEDRRLSAELASLNSRLASTGGDDAALAGLQESQRQARLRLEAFRHQLYAAHPELAVARGETAPSEPAELPALVPDDRTALLEYLVLPDKTYLFVLTRLAGRRSAPEASAHVIELNEPALAERIRDFRERITGGDPAAGRPARAMYDLLVRPAEAQLRGRSRLVIAPDGVLWDLPFAALQPAPDRVLLEDAAVDTVPSLGVWKQMRDRKTGGDASRGSVSILAFGNPQLDQAKDRERFGPLPEAEAEVRALSAIYGEAGARVYTGAAADEPRFKEEAPQARILHLATHGVLDGASPLYSYLALAPGGSGEDGLLEAREILEMELGADVAVLSACETARGRIGAGEGVIGLSWALFVSGCATTVVSLWPVESAATTELMVAFHQGLQQKGPSPLPPAEALRRAALRLREQPSTRHPFYWAGFISVGKGF